MKISGFHLSIEIVQSKTPTIFIALIIFSINLNKHYNT